MAVEEKCHHEKHWSITSTSSPRVWFKLLTKAPTHPRLFISSHFEFQCTQKGNNFGQKKTKKTQKLWFSPQISSKNYFYILEFITKVFWQHGKMWAITPTAAYMSAVNTVSVTYVKGWSRVCAHSPATKKSHILGKRQSSSIHLRNIRFNTGGVSPTSPFPIFWEFRSFTSTQRAASAAAGGETLLQFKVG